MKVKTQIHKRLSVREQRQLLQSGMIVPLERVTVSKGDEWFTFNTTEGRDAHVVFQNKNKETGRLNPVREYMRDHRRASKQLTRLFKDGFKVTDMRTKL